MVQTTIALRPETKKMLDEVKYFYKCRSYDELLRKMVDELLFRIAQPSRDIDEFPMPEEIEKMSDAEILDWLYRLNRKELVLRMSQKLICRSGTYLGKEVGKVIERMHREGAPEEEIQAVVKISMERAKIADMVRRLLEKWLR